MLLSGVGSSSVSSNKLYYEWSSQDYQVNIINYNNQITNVTFTQIGNKTNDNKYITYATTTTTTLTTNNNINNQQQHTHIHI